MNSSVRKYLSDIGRRGGTKSRRHLAPELAQEMVRVREGRKAFKRFRTLCFWSYRADYEVKKEDLEWIVERLRRYGNRQSWEFAIRLCR